METLKFGFKYWKKNLPMAVFAQLIGFAAIIADLMIPMLSGILLNYIIKGVPFKKGDGGMFSFLLDGSFGEVQTYELFFPGKQCKALVFSDAGHGVEINNYVADASRRSGFPALYYSHPNQSAEEIEERIREGGFLGLKSYLDLSPKYLPEAEIRIFDFFPKHQLERMDKMGAIVMLHIPRSKKEAC